MRNNIEYSLSELARNRSIVTGCSLYTEVLGFLDVYVTSRSFLKRVSACNLTRPILCLSHKVPPWEECSRRPSQICSRGFS